MSEESQALDSEEEVDFVSLFAEQGEDDNDESDEEFEEDGEMPDTIEGLKAMLERERSIKSKRNKSLKKSKQANHRMQEQLGAMETRLDDFLSAPQKTPANTDAEKQERKQALEEWRNSVADDPSKAIDFSNYQMEQMQDRMVSLVANMQESFEGKLSELKGATDPEKLKYEADMNSLRTNSQFSGLSDEALLAVVKAMKSKKVPRGNIGGAKMERQPSNEQRLDELKAEYRKQFDNSN